MIWQIITSFFVKKPPDDRMSYGMFWSLSVWFVFFYVFPMLISHIINSTSGIDKRSEIDNNFNREIKRQQKVFDHQQNLLKQEKLRNVDRYKGD